MLRNRLIAGLLVGAFALSGCSGDTRRQASADDTPADPHAGEVRIGMTAPIAVDPATLNPTHPMDVLAADLLYDGLTAFDASTGEAVPALASSWDTADGVTWTFHLDTEREFSNGVPVTSIAVVSSLDRVRALAGSSLAAARLDGIGAITASGDSEVQIVLSSPNYELPALLADPAYGIVGEAKDQAVASQTVVSGRFKVQSGGADGATFVARDGKDLDIDGVEFVRFADAAAAQAALAEGSIDIAPLSEGEEAPAGATEHLVSAATLVLEVASVNGALADPVAHAAILKALDRSAIAAAAAGDADRLADSLVPGGTVDAGACDATACAADPAGAAAAKTLAGIAGPLSIDVPAGTAASAAASKVVEQLGAAGLTATERATDGAGLQATLAAGGLQLAVFVVAGGAPTPDPYLAGVLASTGAENLTGYASAEFDQGLAAARAMPDAAARAAEYRRIEALSLAAAPVIPLATLGERFAVSKAVSGVSPLAGLLFDGTKVSLDR